MPTINICLHCQTQCVGKYCRYCGTVEKRKEMCQANVEVFRAKGLIYQCKICNIDEQPISKNSESAEQNREDK